MTSDLRSEDGGHSKFTSMNGLIAGGENPRTLIDELLEEQQRLTAVERFARKHENHRLPAQERYYRELIPLERPQPGEQYAFGVDLDACTGCKACVSACHSLNGLDDDEIWRNIGLLHGGDGNESYQQTVTTACHHCVDPGCLNGCPVMAYEKDEATGIVRHLDDQCIGCQYCVLKCPYDVPKYSKKRGIVRKCDMCYSRLAANEAPACVQACPHEAITIRVINQAAYSALIQPGDTILPGAFDSSYTKPATAYTTRKPIPVNAEAGDAHALRIEHPHWPLIIMLVLTQIAAGLFVGAASYLLFAGQVFETIGHLLSEAAFGFLMAGLTASVFHLGRPLGAWRAFLGLRTSWMSREIVGFGIFAGLAGAVFLINHWHTATTIAPILRVVTIFLEPSHATGPLILCTALIALAAVFTSGMIYVDTRRTFWSAELTMTKFFGTTFLLGATATASTLAWGNWLLDAPFAHAVQVAAIVATLIRTALFGWEAQKLQESLHDTNHPNHQSALIAWKLQRPLVIARVMLFAISTACSLAAITSNGLGAAWWATAAFASTLLSQFIERYFFFTAVVALRMPGPLQHASAH